MPFPKHPPSVFRSEEMVLCQFFFQDEVAFACIEALGHMDAVQFQDLNLVVVPREKPFFGELEVLEQAQGYLQYLETQIKKMKMKMAPADDDVPTPIPGDLLDIKDTLEKFASEVGDIDHYIQNLKSRHDETIEVETVMALSKKYLKTAFEEVDHGAAPEAEVDELEAGRRAQEMKTMQINFIGGVMRRERFASFEQILWRASRGKVFVKFEHINYEFVDPENDKPVLKTGFIVFFQGEVLKGLATKIAEGFRAKLYRIPGDTAAFDKALDEGKAQRKDLEKIIRITEKQYEELLDICAENFENWYTQLIKIKAVYTVLNCFATKPLIGEGWVPIDELPKIRQRMTEVAKEAGGLSEPLINITECEEEPPTHFWNDKFTAGFQTLIDAYGIATYKEVNPMPFTVITFPFLFSMMFGDLGHGILLFLFGLLMVVREKQMLAAKSKNEIRNIMFGGRYIITLMGIFSIYSGLMYNDCFGAAVNIFGSSWSITQDFNEIRAKDFISLDPALHYSGTPYPFGMDPTWDPAQNKIIFFNSFKMKISIIFGVLHMCFGLVLSVWNDWYFRQFSNIVCMFVPEILFMCFLFGWLCFLTVFKWIAYGANKTFVRGTACAPSVLIHFITMILHKPMDIGEGCDAEMFSYQFKIQNFLFAVSIVCVPWLLLAKPMIIFHQMAKEEIKEKKKAKRKRKYKRKAAEMPANAKEEAMDEEDSIFSEESEREIEQESDAQKQETEVNEKGEKEKEVRQGKGGGEGEQKEKPEEKEIDRSLGDSGEPEKPEKKSVMIIPDAEEIQESKRPREHQNKTELFIHQGIHTIEYILGTISHTASYLRLWALSLAHSQLSNVLWTMLLNTVLKFSLTLPSVGFILLFIGWCLWAVLTIAILVLMEGLSAFLHTLRLHWVEFNSKFYTGLGYAFTPFSFRAILSVERN